MRLRIARRMLIDDECGAPEFFMHAAKQLAGLPARGRKLAPETPAETLAVAGYFHRDVNAVPPKAGRERLCSQLTRMRHGLWVFATKDRRRSQRSPIATGQEGGGGG